MSKEILSIRELEARQASEPVFGKGITVAAGFDLGAKSPLDSRAIVNTIAERNAHVTENRAYEGMLVFVREDKKTYQLIDNEWREFGFNQDDADSAIQGSIVNDLTTGGADKALSAEQGKVLKGLIDGEVERATQAESDLQAEIERVEGGYQAADTLLGNRLTTIEGTGAGSIKKALQDAKAYTDTEIATVKGSATALEARVRANETAVSTTLPAAIATAKGEAITTANEYADELVETINGNVSDLETRVEANETAVSTTLPAAIATAKQGAETTAKAYTDEKIQTVNGLVDGLNGRLTTAEGALAKVPTQIQSAKTEAVEGAKSYTDGKISGIDAAYKAADLVLSNKIDGIESSLPGKLATKQDVLTSTMDIEVQDVSARNISISGNLTVEGTTTTINSENLSVKDRLIELNSTNEEVAEVGLKANVGGEKAEGLIFTNGKWSVAKIDQAETLSVVEGRSREGSITEVKALATEEFVEGKIATVNGDITSRVEGLQSSVTSLEGKVDGHIGNANVHITAVEKGQIAAHEAEIEAAKGGNGSLSGRFEAIEGKLEDLQATEEFSEIIAEPTNVISLTHQPVGKVELFINGLKYIQDEAFTVSGKVLDWDEGIFEIEIDDVVEVKYVHNI